MLKLVLGGSGSGKTSYLYAQLARRAAQGQRSILLVPEQFTSSTEGRIYRELGDGGSGFVESFSFTSLAERILSEEGGAAIQTLTDAGRVALVRRALDQLQDSVQFYRRHRRSAAFCQLAAETIDELKSAGVASGDFARLAAGCGAESERLGELALIYAGYETLLAQTGMDPADRIALAAGRLEEAAAAGRAPAFLEGRAVYIDEFDTFNAPKQRLMAAMLAALPEVTVALCDDGAPAEAGDLGLFSGAKAVAARLKTLARRSGAEVAAPVLLQEDLRHKEAPGLAALTRLLETGETGGYAGPAGEIRLYAAPSREEEARAAAGAIRRLMRQGVRCGQIAVVCREMDHYRAAVRYEFRMADIPLWCDEATTPAFSAPAAALTALLELVCGGDYTEQLSALIKTGLTSLDEEAACALENYAYTWSPRAAEWRADFTKSPRGFGGGGESEKRQAEDKAALEAINRSRACLMGPIETLRARCRQATAGEISRALWFCLEALGAEQAQQRQVDELRAAQGIPAAEEAAREWNVVMGLLDQMARLLGEETIPPDEYAELFALLLRSSDLGHIPQTLDAVMLAPAGKMRLDGPDYVFVLGAAEGEFPAAPGQTGLLTHADRDALMAQEVDLPDCFENRVVREQVCFYKAMTAPAKGLWISWPAGAGQTLAAAAQPIADLLAPPAPALTLLDMAATPGSALDCLGGGWPLDGAQRAALTEALRGAGAAGLGLLERMAQNPPHKIEDLAALGGLLGDRLSVSPSQMEAYASCPYGYFLHYVLGLRPRRKAQLSPDQSGSLMHWVLQMALDPAPGPDNPCKGRMPAPFAQLSDGQLGELAAYLVAEYARRYMPEDTARMRYLLTRLGRSMAGLLCYLRDEQAQSSFAPAACELKIGPGGVRPQVYRLPGGRLVRLVGTVDRADEWVEPDGTRWVRVVDYKTGAKTLDLREVYCGLDCQMLLYLFSLTRDETGRFAGAQPAGVLYLMADPSPATAARAAAQKTPPCTLDGLVRDEEKIFDAMDPGRTGLYLPFGWVDGKPSPYQKHRRADGAKLRRIEGHLDALVAGMGEKLYSGRIEALPLVTRRDPCSWCDYSFICCHEAGGGQRLVKDIAPAHPFEEDAGPGGAAGAGKEDAP